jgi:hypothetical protein
MKKQLGEKQALGFLKYKIESNKLRSVPGKDTLMSIAIELAKRGVTEDDLEKALSSYYLTTENPQFFPSFPAILRNLPKKTERTALPDFKCRECDSTGHIHAELIKARHSKEEPYVGKSFSFKCTCPSGRNISTEFLTWDSIYSDNFKKI